jgi:hypothetical protein
MSLRISNSGNLFQVTRDWSFSGKTQFQHVVYDTRGMGDRRARKHAAMKRRDEMLQSEGFKVPTYCQMQYYQIGIIKSVAFTLTLTMDDNA